MMTAMIVVLGMIDCSAVMVVVMMALVVINR